MYKNDNELLSKSQRIAQKKKLAKDIKIFLKKRKKKGEKSPKKDIKLLLKKKNKKGVIRIFLRGKKRNL